MSKPTDYSGAFDELSDAKKRVSLALNKIIKLAEKELKGVVLFRSTQEYDDNNYYRDVSLSSIDNVSFDEYELSNLDTEIVKIALNTAKNDPKIKLKDLLYLQNEVESEEEKVVYYCLRKNITVDAFFNAVDTLLSIKHLELPQGKVEEE